MKFAWVCRHTDREHKALGLCVACYIKQYNAARSVSPEYRAWKQARGRCRNPHNPDYKHYGGRGIKFLFDSFDEFIDALKTKNNPTGLRPSTTHSIDRYPNNNGNYEFGNVRWATITEQRQNRRTYSTAKNNKSGVKGVSLSGGKWRAYGYRNRKNQMLGCFDTLAEAAAARKAWEHAG